MPTRPQHAHLVGGCTGRSAHLGLFSIQKLLWEGCMTVKALNGRSLLASVWDPKTLLASLEPPSQVPWRLLRKVARWRYDRRSRVMARLLWLRAAAHPCSAVLL